MGIFIEKGINETNGNLLLSWSNEKGEKFQEQWMGPQISYPLSLKKLKDLENLFSIMNEEEFIGVIQQVKKEDNNIHIGRFIIAPTKVGLGLGKESLNKFIDYCFTIENASSVSLTVYDSNKNAKALYEKLGFEIIETIQHPRLKYVMKNYKRA